MHMFRMVYLLIELLFLLQLLIEKYLFKHNYRVINFHLHKKSLLN